jgi:hypothetical protein
MIHWEGCPHRAHYFAPHRKRQMHPMLQDIAKEKNSVMEASKRDFSNGCMRHVSFFI